MKTIKSILENHDQDSASDGTSETWIQKFENEFKINLPTEYRNFLKEINGCEIFGDEVYSIYETEEELPSGDLFYMNRRNSLLDEGLLEVFSNDIDGIFY